MWPGRDAGFVEANASRVAAEDDLYGLVHQFLAGLDFVPGSGLVKENIPTPFQRQTQRALKTLWRLMHELQDTVTASDWVRATRNEAFDAASIRSLAAAQEAGTEAKREYLFLGLINGWVRLHGDPSRDRFLRMVAKYELEDFQYLARIQTRAQENGYPAWLRVEGGLVELAGKDISRHAAQGMLHEYDSDGLIRLYDQPRLRKNNSASREETSADSTSIALWTDVGDALLEFVRDPRKPGTRPPRAMRQTGGASNRSRPSTRLVAAEMTLG